jgi:hypothetical protein
MSMDPDGTNRILKQRINEWYAERDSDRAANLDDWPPVSETRSRALRIRAVVVAVGVRVRSDHRSVPTDSIAATAAQDLAPEAEAR